jgi:hypothetical protein
MSVGLVFLLLLFLVVMPLYGEEHAHAQHYDFERKEDYGKEVKPSHNIAPIILLKTNARRFARERET